MQHNLYPDHSYEGIGAISLVFKALNVLYRKGDYFCGLICHRPATAYYRCHFS